MTSPIAAVRTAISNAMQRLQEADAALAAYVEEAGPARQPVPGVYDRYAGVKCAIREAEAGGGGNVAFSDAIADEVVRHLRESQGAVRLVMGDDGQFQLSDAVE